MREDKTSEQLRSEVATLRRRVGELEAAEAAYRQTEQEIKISEQRYRGTLDNMLEGCQIIGYDWRYIYVNESVVRHARKTKEELLGHTMVEAYPGIENTEMFSYLRRCMEKRIPQSMENEFTFPDGAKGWFELSIEPVPDGVLVFSLDITDRKRLTENIIHLNEMLRLIRRINQLIVQTDDEKELLNKACQYLTNSRNYGLVWIGEVREGSNDIPSVAQAGVSASDLLSIEMTRDDSGNDRSPTETAIKTGKPIVLRDIANGLRYSLWTEQVRRIGFNACTSLPLTIEHKVTGALTIYSATHDAFNEEEQDLLVEMAGDISLGIEKIRQRQERKRVEEQLVAKSQALEQTLRELTALNKLFREHLDIRFRSEEAHKRLANNISKIVQEIQALSSEAEAQEKQVESYRS